MNGLELFLVGLVLSAAVDPDGAAYEWDDFELGIYDSWDRLTRWFNRDADRLGWVFAPGSAHAWGCTC